MLVAGRLAYVALCARDAVIEALAEEGRRIARHGMNLEGELAKALSDAGATPLCRLTSPCRREDDVDVWFFGGERILVSDRGRIFITVADAEDRDVKEVIDFLEIETRFSPDDDRRWRLMQSPGIVF